MGVSVNTIFTKVRNVKGVKPGVKLYVTQNALHTFLVLKVYDVTSRAGRVSVPRRLYGVRGAVREVSQW